MFWQGYQVTIPGFEFWRLTCFHYTIPLNICFQLHYLWTRTTVARRQMRTTSRAESNRLPPLFIVHVKTEFRNKRLIHIRISSFCFQSIIGLPLRQHLNFQRAEKIDAIASFSCTLTNIVSNACQHVFLVVRKRLELCLKAYETFAWTSNRTIIKRNPPRQCLGGFLLLHFN